MATDPRIYAIYGNVSSGKSTLAKALSKHLGEIPHLSSDAIREELSGSPGASPSPNVFETMKNRMMSHLAAGNSVIMDSTGMSKDYKSIIDNIRGRVPTHVIKLSCDPNSWRAREQGRSDRWKLDDKGQKTSFKMPERAYLQSSSVTMNPHLSIDTTNLHPDEVFRKTLDHITKNPNPEIQRPN